MHCRCRGILAELHRVLIADADVHGRSGHGLYLLAVYHEGDVEEPGEGNLYLILRVRVFPGCARSLFRGCLIAFSGHGRQHLSVIAVVLLGSLQDLPDAQPRALRNPGVLAIGGSDGVVAPLCGQDISDALQLSVSFRLLGCFAVLRLCVAVFLLGLQCFGGFLRLAGRFLIFRGFLGFRGLRRFLTRLYNLEAAFPVYMLQQLCLAADQVAVLVVAACLVMGMQLQLSAYGDGLGLIALVCMGMGALSLRNLAGQLLAPGMALVRMDMGAFRLATGQLLAPGVALFRVDMGLFRLAAGQLLTPGVALVCMFVALFRIGTGQLALHPYIALRAMLVSRAVQAAGQLALHPCIALRAVLMPRSLLAAGQLALHFCVALRAVLVPRGFLLGADKRLLLFEACGVMHMGLLLRQRAHQRAVLPVAVVVVDMDGIVCLPAGQLPFAVPALLGMPVHLQLAGEHLLFAVQRLAAHGERRYCPRRDSTARHRNDTSQSLYFFCSRKILAACLFKDSIVPLLPYI